MRTEKKIGKRNIWKDILTILVIVVSFATMASATNGEYKFPDNAPFQNAMKQAIADGTISTNDIEGSPEYRTEILEKNETHIKLKSTTRIIFKNPRGAGYVDNKWPKFEIEKDGKIINYDKQIKESILVDIKNIKDDVERSNKLREYSNYNFENASRIYELIEIVEVTYPRESNVSTILPLGNNYYDILMGFTKDANWQYSKEENLYDPIFGFHLAWAKVSTDIDAALGLRLPTTIGLYAPDVMIRGKSYNLNTNIDGKDWDANKYSSVNVPPENGNEFVARYQVSLTAQGWVRVIGNIGPYYLNKGADYGKSFETPFGPYEQFPIPDLLELSPDQSGLKIYQWPLWAGVGLKIDPDIGSDKITANWYTYGDAIGNGMVKYNMPYTDYYFGPVNAGNYDTTTDYATVILSDYRYYFTICRLSLAANLQGGLVNVNLGIQTPYVDIITYDCGGTTGRYYLGVHKGTTANNVDKYILVKSPITVISPNGGEKWVKGTVNTIKWNYFNSGSNVRIELKNGTSIKSINSSTPNDGSYNWYIPMTQTIGTDYKIKITSTSNPTYYDWSNNNFIISNPYMIVKYPNGGEVWQRGTTKTITWKSYGNTGPNVKIQLLKSGTPNLINSSTPNDGSYSWKIPSEQTVGSDYKIRITSTNNPKYNDTSNNNFRIY